MATEIVRPWGRGEGVGPGLKQMGDPTKERPHRPSRVGRWGKEKGENLREKAPSFLRCGFYARSMPPGVPDGEPLPGLEASKGNGLSSRPP